MKILLVEDDQATRSLLTTALTAHHYTINHAADGDAGLKLAEAVEYDLILLDVMMPKLDGISLCKQLRAQGCQIPILLLTAKDSTSDRILGLDAGADDYVVKPFEVDELLARIRALLRRNTSVRSSVIPWETVRFDSTNNEVTCNDRPIHLTPKEYCLLELFLLNPKRIFSRKAILERLWDFAETPGEETVSTHIKCLRQKLKAAGASDPIETIHGLGYRLRPAQAVAPAKAAIADLPKDYPHKEDYSHKKDYRRTVEAATSKIWEKFKPQFMEQVAVLEQMAVALTADKLTEELQQQAVQEAHKLAGALGIFGSMQGSQLARELETLLRAQTPLGSEHADHVSVIVAQLQRALQQSAKPAAQSVPALHTPLILIVDDDLPLAERIRIEAIAWGLQVEVATDLQVARKAIAQTPPDVVLLDLNFPSPAERGLDLLQELMQRVPKIPVLVFSGQGGLEDRLQVTRLGGGVFLQKPLPTYEILKAVTNLLTRQQTRHHNRVLAIDDAPAVLEKLCSLLQPLGIQVTVLEQPQHFWQVLTATEPNLLILDLEMPGINGIELCQAVRSDPKWHNLPILFLSAHTEAREIDRAFAAGADDYISKLVEETELVTRIICRLRRAGFQES